MALPSVGVGVVLRLRGGLWRAGGAEEVCQALEGLVVVVEASGEALVVAEEDFHAEGVVVEVSDIEAEGPANTGIHHQQNHWHDTWSRNVLQYVEIWCI